MTNGQRIGYARVSTTGQDLSLQRDRLADCDKIFEEKASGAKGTKRAALEEAMSYARDGDVFVVTKLDRLARSVLELMQITQALQDKKCDLQVLDQELDTSTPTGRLIFHVLVVIGEFERELITEQAREGRERAMAAGVKFGRKPKLTKRKERELLEMLESVAISKEDLARQFNVSKATVYRLAAKLDQDFVEQAQLG